MNPKEIFAILKETASDWMEDQAPTLGAALAYYTVFSLAPLLIIALPSQGWFLGKRPRRVRSSTNCGAY
jgi:membrane protein